MHLLAPPSIPFRPEAPRVPFTPSNPQSSRPLHCRCTQSSNCSISWTGIRVDTLTGRHAIPPVPSSAAPPSRTPRAQWRAQCKFWFGGWCCMVCVRRKWRRCLVRRIRRFLCGRVGVGCVCGVCLRGRGAEPSLRFSSSHNLSITRYDKDKDGRLCIYEVGNPSLSLCAPHLAAQHAVVSHHHVLRPPVLTPPPCAALYTHAVADILDTQEGQVHGERCAAAPAAAAAAPGASLPSVGCFCRSLFLGRGSTREKWVPPSGGW